MTLDEHASDCDEEIESRYELSGMLHCLIQVCHFSPPTELFLKVFFQFYDMMAALPLISSKTAMNRI